MKRAFLFAALAIVAGCGGLPPAKVATLVIDPAPANVERFHREEGELLRALSAVDARLAHRMGTNPSEAELSRATMSAVMAGDSSIVVHEGALDVFSFESRARGLEAASKSAEAWTYPLAGEAKLERDLVKRLIAEEKARLSEEKRLPTSASELVRALVLTWSAAATPAALKEKDGWLAQRMDDVHASLKNDALTTLELNELDDALDPLERLTVGYTGTAAALARLRIALAEVHPAASPVATWDEVQSAALAHLGMRIDLVSLRSDLERLRADFSVEIKREKSSLPRTDAELKEVLADDTCDGHDGVRAFRAPPERSGICGLLRSFVGSRLLESHLGERRVLHDEVTVALWALAIHGDRMDPRKAAEKYPLTTGFPVDREARLLRRAVVRPVSVLGVGWAATFLLETHPEAQDLADRWLAFGDAPLDVIATELVIPASARTPRASPGRGP